MRLAGLDVAMLRGLEQRTTGTSGRTEIALEQAPLALLQHLFGPEDRAVWVGRMVPELVSPGTVVNQRVVGDGSSVTVHFGGPARVLALR